MSSATASAPPPPAPLRVVFYRDQESTAPAHQLVTWGQFVDLLTNYVETSPCTVAPGPDQCIGAKCPYKSHSTFPDNPMAWSPVEIVGQRLDVNVRAVTLLTLDFDHLSLEEGTKAVAALSKWEHVRHTTHNCRPDDIGFRVVLALSRPVHANQWHRFLAAAVEYLGISVIDKHGKLQPDRTCKNRSRFYYRPSHPKDTEHSAEHVRGKILDVDEVFAWAEKNVPVAAALDYNRTALPDEEKWDLESDAVLGLIDVVSRTFPPNRRHELALALGGMMRRAGASLEAARYILRESFREGGSDDPEARANTVDHTYALTDDSAMTGFTRVCGILGEEDADEIGEYITQVRNETIIRAFQRAPERNVHALVLASSPAVVELGALREQVRDLANHKARSQERNDKILAIFIRRVLDGHVLAKPGGYGDVETVLDDADRGVGRFKAIGKVMSALAYGLPSETTWEGVFQIVRMSIVGMVIEPGDTPWITVAERKFRAAQDQRKVGDIERVQKENERVAMVTQAAYTASNTVPLPGVPPDGANWRDHLTINNAGAPANTAHNARIFLRNHPDFCGYLRWNEVSKRVEVTGGPMLQYAKSPIEILVAGIEDYLSNVHKLQVAHQALCIRVISVARSNPYDPIKEFLRSLKWDGQPRISNWLKTYCGATQELDDYLEKVGRRWMISLAARGLQPGCKVDNVLVVQGDGGIGKSTIFSILAGEWFCDTAINLGDKDSRMMAGLYWLCELAECVAFKRVGNDMLKSFFSSQKDRFRPPYSKDFEDSPRRAVFVATANEDAIFSDDTGNRKYWPVACKYTKTAIEMLRRDRDQLLAEAVVAFDAGEVWHFTYEEIAITEQVTDDYMVENVPAMMVREWWFATAKMARPKSVTTLDFAKEIFEDKPIKDNDLQRIGYALKKLGFRRQRDGHGARAWRYYATQALLDADSNRKGFFALAGGKPDDEKGSGKLADEK